MICVSVQYRFWLSLNSSKKHESLQRYVTKTFINVIPWILRQFIKDTYCCFIFGDRFCGNRVSMSYEIYSELIMLIVSEVKSERTKINIQNFVCE